MAHVVKFPAPPIDRLAENCIERILEPELERIRESLAAAARVAPIRINIEPVGETAIEALEALEAEGRILDMLRQELDEDAYAESRSRMLTIVDDALYAVARRLSTEAIEARESELAAQEGTPEWEGVRVV